MKKKIVFFIYELGSGGAARTIVNIVNYLNKDLFEPIIVTLNYEGSYEKYVHPSLRIEKLPAKRLRSAIIPFCEFIKREQPDLIFSTIPNYNTIAIAARILSRTPSKNIVREAAFLGGNFLENVKLFLYGQLYRFSTAVVALSDGVKENIEKRYLVPKEKITTIYNPIDLQFIQKQATEGKLPKEHEQLFQRNRKTIVSAGRFVKEKDQRTLLKAFAKLNKEIPSTLILLGEGELKEDLQALAKTLQVEEYVYFIGFQKNPYIYFRKADVFALSSTTEGFGHVLVEALATETLIVSTDCKPGSEEVLQGGKYGFLSPVGDAEKMKDQLIKALSLSQREREQLIKAGKKRAKDFSAERIVKQYEEVFLKALGDDS